MSFKVGDSVDYNPTMLRDIHHPVRNTKITDFIARDPQGLFKTDMAVIERVDSWVPCYDLKYSGGN